MKRTTLIRSLTLAALFLLATCLTSTSLLAEPLTNGERDRAMSHLHATRKLYLDLTMKVSQNPAQWNFKPAPNRWSVADCAEHLAETEPFLRGYMEQLLSKTPVDEAKRAERKKDLAKLDEGVLGTIADRTQKASAPEPLKPTGRFPQASVIETFRKRRDETIKYIETTNEDLRGRVVQMPAGTMDLYQVILMISAHTERHYKQMQEVMADPNFPKK